jgi:hypothetical protein
LPAMLACHACLPCLPAMLITRRWVRRPGGVLVSPLPFSRSQGRTGGPDEAKRGAPMANPPTRPPIPRNCAPRGPASRSFMSSASSAEADVECSWAWDAVLRATRAALTSLPPRPPCPRRWRRGVGLPLPGPCAPPRPLRSVPARSVPPHSSRNHPDHPDLNPSSVAPLTRRRGRLWGRVSLVYPVSAPSPGPRPCPCVGLSLTGS